MLTGNTSWGDIMRTVSRVVVAVLIVAGLAWPAPARAAATTYTAYFLGTIDTPNGLGWICTYGRCPPESVSDGRTSPGNFSSTVCLGGGAVLLKSDKLPVTAPICTMFIAVTVTGFCEWFTGTGTVWVDTLGIVGAGDHNYYSGSVTFTGVEGKVVLQGPITKYPAGTQTGTFTATVFIAPDPLYGNCSNGTAVRWVMEGVFNMTLDSIA